MYDFIVVGAGTAGAVIAARLAEGGERVLLLEAGARAGSPVADLPGTAHLARARPELSLAFESEPDPSCDGRRHTLRAGCMLGGSSAINALAYMRGAEADFDHWRELGNTGWGASDVRPYFARAEGMDGARTRSLALEEAPPGEAMASAFLAAAQAEGLPPTEARHAAGREGAGKFLATVRRGRRVSAAAAYLGRRLPPGVHLVLGAAARHVLFEGARAVGIAYARGGETLEARAAGGVVLAAGAIGSPLLLERSGVGAPGRIKAAGIAPRVELPGVGEGLQDHFAVLLEYAARPIASAPRTPAGGGLLRAGLAWLARREGPLARLPSPAYAFLRTRIDVAAPDIAVHCVPGGFREERPDLALTLAVSATRPEARGSVHLSAPEAAAKPRLSLAFLSESGDRETLAAGLERARGLAAASPLAGLLGPEVSPGQGAREAEALLAHARATGLPLNHLSGTCKMGVTPMAVVGPDLKVRGASHLAVADASIMPRLVSANPLATVVMIAEKAADLLLAARR